MHHAFLIRGAALPDGRTSRAERILLAAELHIMLGEPASSSTLQRSGPP